MKERIHNIHQVPFSWWGAGEDGGKGYNSINLDEMYLSMSLLSQTSQGILVLQLLLTFGSETFPRSWLYIWRSLRIAADLENLEQSGINWQVDYLTTWLPWLPQQVHCNLSSKAKTASNFVFYLYWLYLLQLFITWKFILTTYVRGCVKCT